MKSLASLLLLSGAAFAQTLVLTHANVIDGVSAQPVRDATVVIRDGKIERMGAGGDVPAGAQVLDLKGKWVLPGFVDAHAHVGELRAARLALASGATTLRDMGVAHFADIGIRDLNHGGVADLPDIVAAGYHVRPRPDENLFVDIPKLADLMNAGVNGPDNVRRMVRAQIERGVNMIKTMATERAGLPDTDPRKRVYSEEEMAAIVDEARKANLHVAVHAHGDEGAAAAVRAGVRSIEHGTYLSDQTLALMKEKGTYLVPTVATVQDLIDPGGDYDNALLSIRGRAMMPRLREVVGKAWKMGVKIVAGTDTSYGPNSNRRIAHEIAEFVALGMSPMAAIQSATAVSATCLGIDSRTGSLKPGLEADLIAVDRNPLEDPTSLFDVLLVVNDGKVALNRLKF